ncbi:RcnB family protein [Chelatococcus sp. GCM10030263]|uniref:RcnB family protein n=1 Tax=Chelatococcus sp. GCM10030263 TaxID=3273387 RepID=UPI0036205980
MKKLLIAGLALALIDSSAAFAQQRYDRSPDHGPVRHDNMRDHRPQQFERGPASRPRATQRPAWWARGKAVPSSYRRHVVSDRDWRRHRLSRPPRGHQWVEVDGNYAMINMATGIISSLVQAR